MNTLAALVLLLPGPLQDTPEILPESPKGWRYERLDFPLSFAPELEFEGFEELSFAPGMFAPDSDSYFSYALGIRLEGDHDVDAGFVQSFLEGYYRGLCRAVGEGRDLEFDYDSIAAAVTGGDGEFAATVAMVDAFVSGEPLSLRFELSVHPRPRSTELLGLASPMPEEAAVWKELRDLRGRWRAGLALPVFLNHLYVVPDGETYRALAGSEFLRESLAVSEERTTVRADLTYSGLYFYGRRTYFEFLEPGSTDRVAPGGSGLALGLEEEGGVKRLAERLGEAGVRTFAGSRTRAGHGEQQPWFEILGVEAAHAGSRLSLFAMEYDPRFLTSWHAELPPEGGGIARRRILERYAAVLGQGERRREALLEDVTEVFLELDEAERERLLAVCRAAGYELDQGVDAWVCHAPQFRLVVRASEGPGRVTGLRMALRAPVEREPIQLGKARLSFQGRTATFSFAP